MFSKKLKKSNRLIILIIRLTVKIQRVVYGIFYLSHSKFYNFVIDSKLEAETVEFDEPASKLGQIKQIVETKKVTPVAGKFQKTI